MVPSDIREDPQFLHLRAPGSTSPLQSLHFGLLLDWRAIINQPIGPSRSPKTPPSACLPLLLPMRAPTPQQIAHQSKIPCISNSSRGDVAFASSFCPLHRDFAYDREKDACNGMLPADLG